MPAIVGAIGLIKKETDKLLPGISSIVKIGQNTEKSPGDLMGFAVTQTPVKAYQLTSL